MHISYEKLTGHKADFRVRYKFYSAEEGGRQNLPYQGYRSDFWYEHKEHKQNYLFMIWPEFEDENGNIIEENNKPVPREGTARMWILNPDRREYHDGKIEPSIIGYFMEGGRRTAKCTVIEILDIKNNPTTNKK